MYSANDSPRPFSLRSAFSGSQSCALLRWIRRWTANFRITWAYSRLTRLSSPLASSSFDLTVGYRSCLESPRFFPSPALRHRRVYVRVVNLHIPGKHLVSGVFSGTLCIFLFHSSAVCRETCAFCASSDDGRDSRDILQKTGTTSFQGRRRAQQKRCA